MTDYKITDPQEMRVDDGAFRAPHPGPMIREQLEHVGLSIPRAAEAMRINRSNLNNVLLGKLAVSPDLALRLEALLADGLAELLIRWQAEHDLGRARERREGVVECIQRVAA